MRASHREPLWASPAIHHICFLSHLLSWFQKLIYWLFILSILSFSSLLLSWASLCDIFLHFEVGVLLGLSVCCVLNMPGHGGHRSLPHMNFWSWHISKTTATVFNKMTPHLCRKVDPTTCWLQFFSVTFCKTGRAWCSPVFFFPFLFFFFFIICIVRMHHCSHTLSPWMCS